MVNKVMSSMDSFEQASLGTPDSSPHRVGAVGDRRQTAQSHVDAKHERKAC